MSLKDRATGRLKQAAGDLAGSEDLRRQGKQEERKGEVKEERARAEQAAELERERADRKSAEVEHLEGSTDPDAIAQGNSREELYERAQELGVPGRSEMSKDELAEEIRARE